MEIQLPFAEPEELEAGDLIISAGVALLVLRNSEDYWSLVDLEQSILFAENLNHPVHVINHVKKYIDPVFEIIKSHKIKLTVGH
jgi:hypothetical protein